MPLFITDEIFLLHRAKGHPECPERISSILDYLAVHEIWDSLKQIPARDATEEELLLIHTRAHLERMCSRAKEAPLWLDADTYMNEYSHAAALRAAGAVLSACEAILSGKGHHAFCLVRPPGHHATPQQAMGFCLYNNVAIAARWLDRKVLVVDWDVHHGNGTQEALAGDPKVIYLSTHRWPFYPGSGAAEETGGGNLVNIPLPAGTSSEKFLLSFEMGLESAISKLRPEFVLISCGFDAYREDPIGGLGLSSEDYGTLTHLVRDMTADVPIVSVLEGGYALDGLGGCTAAHIEALC
ncbi:MAG: histone deacetylase [Planctomycetota bacterium]|nr:histone deacetylase [Planctomycetota bacterium]